ncbi:MAG: lipoyl domain-containing protein [Spirochaetales bacterium]|nr:lipoyl domain-containing protein [Spirochaetales bacterium]
MSSKKVPVNIPRYGTPVRVDCECRRSQLDLEFKFLTLQWLKQVGEWVEKDDVLCEGEVEKLIIEILSPAGGMLSEICISDGEECGIHQPIAFIDES